MPIPQMMPQALFPVVFDLFHFSMAMTVVEVIAPTANGLIELANNVISRYGVHIECSVALDFLFDGLHGFVCRFNQWKMLPILFTLNNANAKTQKFKSFSS